ncbi:MAG: hypothetical protein NTZ92_05965 [Candidatus Omnitrophica bacterium]|nr:hypothetical protein [Candidatus Omnitrophota bacterium]
MKKIIIVSVIVAAVFSITFFSIYQTTMLREDFKKEVVPAQEEMPQTRNEPVVLVPANPEDYGMTVIDETNKPRTQEDWDRLLTARIRDVKSELTAQQMEEVKAKIQEDSQKTQEKLKKIDEVIAKCNEILKSDPSNQDARDKLNRLMMLKSISKELPR